MAASISTHKYAKVFVMPLSVKDILIDTLQQLERSPDSQANDPAVMKLRDDIAILIFRLHLAKGSSDSQESEPVAA